MNPPNFAADSIRPVPYAVDEVLNGASGGLIEEGR